MLSKRLFDFVAALLGLLVLSPLFVGIIWWIKLDSPGPAFFRQVRVGRHGVSFTILKFRTMRSGAEAGGQLTVDGDPRVTPVGEILRRYKLDEIPQLFNVLAGKMSLVGPRPEVPHYVAYYPEDVRRTVLSVPPGMTDWASIEYKDEGAILERASDPERVYVEQILPIKLGYCVQYVNERNFFGDLKIIFATLAAIADGNGALAEKSSSSA